MGGALQGLGVTQYTEAQGGQWRRQGGDGAYEQGRLERRIQLCRVFEGRVKIDLGIMGTQKGFLKEGSIGKDQLGISVKNG